MSTSLLCCCCGAVPALVMVERASTFCLNAIETTEQQRVKSDEFFRCRRVDQTFAGIIHESADMQDGVSVSCQLQGEDRVVGVSGGMGIGILGRWMWSPWYPDPFVEHVGNIEDQMRCGRWAMQIDAKKVDEENSYRDRI
ncbi:hypothetical protein BKA81DRAFT_379714 [Phyllosticta paracitricarpa]|uniref:Uncharacterized protein n=1 Tax=Phyllosticta citricarpa TaxID=55181 RepID=A0ABR1LYH0_9PEZI